MEQIYVHRNSSEEEFNRIEESFNLMFKQLNYKILIKVETYNTLIDNIDEINKFEKKHQCQRIFIPTIMNVYSAYSYDGVENAIKCYLNFLLNEVFNFSIVLVGSEDKAAFYDHCEYSNFLKCPNVDYVFNNINDIKDYCESHVEIKEIDINKAKESLKRINIRPLSIYRSHHSIVNEWSIYRWSSYLEIDNIKVKEDVESQLYYRYLKVINEIKEGDKNKYCIYGNNGNILLIDDEEGKGWGIFFRGLFKRHNNIQFESIGSEFNQNKTYKDIEDVIKEKIEKYNPDLVILDLRLLDCDFDEKDPHELTGAKILDEIKNINKGIQVIVFSASNKIWNYQDLDYDGIIVKESPEQSVNLNYTKECIKGLMDSITLGLLKASFLKEKYNKLEELKILISNNNEIDDFIKNKMINNINVAYDLLLIGLRNPQRDKILANSKGKYEQLKNIYNQFEKYLTYSYLQLFLLLEDYVRCDNVFDGDSEISLKCNGTSYLIAKQVEVDKGKYYKTVINYNQEEHKYKLEVGEYHTRNLDLNFKINILLYFIYDNPSKIEDWIKLDWWRNKIAHSDDNKKNKDSLFHDYSILIDFLMFMFDPKNYSSKDMSLFALSD